MSRTRAIAGAARGRAKRALPLLLLLLALGVTGVGAFQAHRAQRSHRATAEALLRDYGTFAAWSFSERAVAFLDGSIRRTLHPLREALPSGDPRPELERLLADGRGENECGCGRPLAGRFAFHAPLSSEARSAAHRGATFVGEAPTGAHRAAVIEAVIRDARARTSGPAYGVVPVLAAGATPTQVAYAWVVGAAGDTVVYAVEVDAERYRGELRRAAEHADLLPASLTHGAPNDSLLAIHVLAAGGNVLFASTHREPPKIHGEQILPDELGGAVVRAAVLPEAAERLIIGGMPADRTPALLLLFGLGAALVIVAVSLLRKENQLAGMRSDFVASVSHELRTPLAQVRLFLETLRLGRTRTGAEREWALERIDRESLRLQNLVEKILHFSRAERGAVPTDRVTTDLSAEVEDAAASVCVLLRPGKAKLRLDLPRPLLAPVHRDSFRQVVLNLLDNAVKYGPAGQVIRVTGERRDGCVRIAVEDQGPGVSARERRLIWEPFRRGRSAVGGVAAGGGIGLSIVREVVRAHGGRALVEDAPGGGARFVIELPSPPSARSGQVDAERVAARLERKPDAAGADGAASAGAA